MLKFKGTYEIIAPEDIGLIRANDSGIVLGKLRYGIMFLMDSPSLTSLSSYFKSYLHKSSEILNHF